MPTRLQLAATMRKTGWTLFLVGAGWFFGSRASLLVLDTLNLSGRHLREHAEGLLEFILLGYCVSWIPMLGGLFCLFADAVKRELRKGSNRRRRGWYFSGGAQRLGKPDRP